LYLTFLLEKSGIPRIPTIKKENNEAASLNVGRLKMSDIPLALQHVARHLHLKQPGLQEYPAPKIEL
jgi:hypothetical protein